MKKTTLYNTHLNLNAKMTPFGGYEMPVQYSGVTKEHLAVRKGVGVFDVSHMGEFMVSGPKAFDLLQYKNWRFTLKAMGTCASAPTPCKP